MPIFAPTAPRIPVKINGIAITGPAPYSPGHVLTDPEARYLNRQVVTSVANPLPSAMKALAEAAAKEGKTYIPPTPEALQAEFDRRYAEYEVGSINRGAPGTPVDPVAKLAHQIASGKVVELLQSKGKNVSAFRKAKDEAHGTVFNKLVAQYIEANAWVKALAESQVKAIAEASGDTADDFDIPDVTEESAAADTQPGDGTDTQPDTDTGKSKGL